MKPIIYSITFLLIYACSQSEKNTTTKETPQQNIDVKVDSNTKNTSYQYCLDSFLNATNLIDIQSVDSSIQIDLKYASDDNFMHQQLYHSINKVYLQKEVANRLVKCQQFLSSIKPNYHLLVYDGVRPISVQQRMWDALDSIPVSRRGRFVSNPKNHSVHNYGAAVDLTIVDETNQPLDMGAEYDDIRKIAYPSMENFYLKQGELSIEQLENRQLLRKVMRHQGFTNIPSEWWHFNAYSRNEVKQKFHPIKDEPECR